MLKSFDNFRWLQEVLAVKCNVPFCAPHYSADFKLEPALRQRTQLVRLQGSLGTSVRVVVQYVSGLLLFYSAFLLIFKTSCLVVYGSVCEVGVSLG